MGMDRRLIVTHLVLLFFVTSQVSPASRNQLLGKVQNMIQIDTVSAIFRCIKTITYKRISPISRAMAIGCESRSGTSGKQARNFIVGSSH